MPRTSRSVLLSFLLCALQFVAGCGKSRIETVLIVGKLPATGTVGVPYDGSLTVSFGVPGYGSDATGLPPGLTGYTEGYNGNVFTVSGVPTTAGSYPVTVTAEDAEDSSATYQITIVISAAPASTESRNSSEDCITDLAPRGSESRMASPYAFVLARSDEDGGPVREAGSFTANGTGQISAATLDTVSMSNGAHSYQIQTENSSYSLGADGRGCLYLSVGKENSQEAHASSNAKLGRGLARRFSFSNSAAKPTTSFVFSFSLDPANAAGRIQESQSVSSGRSSVGEMRRQAPADWDVSRLSPQFSFGLDGWFVQDATYLQRAAIAGSYALEAGSIENGVADANIGGVPTGELTAGGGMLTQPSKTSGRGKGIFSIPTSAGILQVDFAYYIVNSSTIYFVTDDAPERGALLLSGRALAADRSATFPSGGYIIAQSGIDIADGVTRTAANVVQLGTMNVASTGALQSFHLVTSDAGATSDKTYNNGSVAIDALSGRGTFSNVGAHAPVVYFTSTANASSIAAFVVGTDSSASSGFLAAIDVERSDDDRLPGSFAYKPVENLSGARAASLRIANGGEKFSVDLSRTETNECSASGTNADGGQPLIFIGIRRCPLAFETTDPR